MRRTQLLALAVMVMATASCTAMGALSPPGAGANLHVQSRINGEFTCWDGSTVFRLVNGQTWVQTIYSYKDCFHYRPEVFIYYEAGGYRMYVAGVDGSVPVRRTR